MSGSAEFVSAPIVEVTKDNATVLGPVIRGAIIGADFIAIDCVSFLLGNVIFSHISCSTFTNKSF